MLDEIPKLRVRENLTEDEAFETEIALILAIGRADRGSGPLTNMTDGGEGWSNASVVRWARPGAHEEASIRQSARYATEEGRASAREVMNRPEVVAKLSAAGKRYFEDPANLEANRQRGIAQYSTEEARRAQGERIAMSHSRPEVRAKMSAAKAGKPPPNKGKKTGKPSWNSGLKTGPQSPEERARRSAILTKVCKRPEIREMRRQAAFARWARHREMQET